MSIVKNLLLTAATVLLVTPGGWADLAQELKTAITTTRGHVVAFVGAADKDTQSKEQAAIQTTSKDVDAQLSKALSSASDSQKPTLTDLQAVWVPYTQTRDTELIPAVLAGQTDKAKTLATGVQKDRFQKMMSLLDTLK